MIKTGSDFSGVGAFNQALERLGIQHENVFACDMDKFARKTYCLNFGNESDVAISNSKQHDKICDLVFKYAIKGQMPPDEIIEQAEKIANSFSFYYPMNVYNRNIPENPIDIYVPTPPCQSFSLAGKRQGENSEKGVLFYNSHEFIKKNNPRYFIFENVKGLLSDDGGKTFQRWIDYLGGKTVNGNPVIFPHENSVPYHVYYQVMNAKHYGVPQNRERIFIIGIRDDADNEFSFPKPFHLVKRLKDILESEVDEKYFLSDKMLNHLIKHPRSQDFINEQTDSVACITANYAKQSSDLQYLETKVPSVICFGRSETEKARRKKVFAKTGKDSGSFKDKELIVKNQDYYDTLLANPNPQKKGLIMISANNSKGYDIAEEEDSINFSNPNSETRRGRVGHGVAQTLDTACNQGVLVKNKLEGKVFEIRNDEGIREFEGNVCGTIRTIDSGGDKHTMQKQRIRRLTPFECFRLMDFNEDFKWDVSDSQAYKQAGNSIVVNCLVEIISKLKL
jgi:DNA (cytosine-5)-methyltransferase 1